MELIVYFSGKLTQEREGRAVLVDHNGRYVLSNSGLLLQLRKVRIILNSTSIFLV